jgi:hypothetical protein
MHYVPAWVKLGTKRFPNVIRPDGELIDVLSPLSHNTLEADKKAFVTLMHHLKQTDGEQHTVILIQVENESGNIGSVRNNSAEANRLFAGIVPPDLLDAAHKKPGTWSQVFGAEADETFQLYYQARYINEMAAAGKAEFSIPYYINVWLDYPPTELPGDKDIWSDQVSVAANQRVIVDVPKAVSRTEPWHRGEKLASAPRFNAGVASATEAVAKPSANVSASTSQVYCGETLQLKWTSTDTPHVEIRPRGRGQGLWGTSRSAQANNHIRIDGDGAGRQSNV